MDREAEAAGELPEYDMPDMDDECTQPNEETAATQDATGRQQTEQDGDTGRPRRQESGGGAGTSAARASEAPADEDADPHVAAEQHRTEQAWHTPRRRPREAAQRGTDEGSRSAEPEVTSRRTRERASGGRRHRS